ncbi:hypothetical protein [Thauera linaloolentis]|uniref:Uncharacterized protein n=1 Tax=Thauera linaloolentis (strain DSM 12138 / JCM 21573 / CCUG 41526 / CIP 105981 / IAM 15112 / NBRC 102519 / 47Lol) TaxID=1123367 RepID=N6ZE71_THAL4|nr:hypothetical protein [Thauera linaloolentis]ENO90444.1 hypothetical protein C666_01030 [Thauera linaloolentis 47Lol = DSM 12138]MCM8566305.1 hypothetical protein [Thauera linaloolentis]
MRIGDAGGSAVVRQWLVAGLLAMLGSGALAHEPIAKCELVDEATVRCRGGYGHGEGAPDAIMDVIGHDGTVLLAGKLGEDSTLTFKRPEQPFYVLFDVGPGHQVVIEQEEISPLQARRR